MTLTMLQGIKFIFNWICNIINQVIIISIYIYILLIDSHILISAPQPYFNFSLMNTHYQTLKFNAS